MGQAVALAHVVQARVIAGHDGHAHAHALRVPVAGAQLLDMDRVLPLAVAGVLLHAIWSIGHGQPHLTELLKRQVLILALELLAETAVDKAIV